MLVARDFFGKVLTWDLSYTESTAPRVPEIVVLPAFCWADFTMSGLGWRVCGFRVFGVRINGAGLGLQDSGHLGSGGHKEVRGIRISTVRFGFGRRHTTRNFDPHLSLLPAKSTLRQRTSQLGRLVGSGSFGFRL